MARRVLPAIAPIRPDPRLISIRTDLGIRPRRRPDPLVGGVGSTVLDRVSGEASRPRFLDEGHLLLSRHSMKVFDTIAAALGNA
jgi:hypothetical protein